MTPVQREWEDRIVQSPWNVSAEYFRQKQGEQQPIIDLSQIQSSRQELEARQKAIEERVSRLEADKPAAEATPSHGYVVKVGEHYIYTDLTEEKGIGIGTVLIILREGVEELRHPVTGRPLGQVLEEVGTARVVELRPAFSIAEVVKVKAGEAIQVKDRVRPAATR